MKDLSNAGHGWVHCEPIERNAVRMVYEAKALAVEGRVDLTPVELFAVATGRAYVEHADQIIGVKLEGEPGDTPEEIAARAKAETARAASTRRIPTDATRQPMTTDNPSSSLPDDDIPELPLMPLQADHRGMLLGEQLQRLLDAGDPTAIALMKKIATSSEKKPSKVIRAVRPMR